MEFVGKKAYETAKEAADLKGLKLTDYGFDEGLYSIHIA